MQAVAGKDTTVSADIPIDSNGKLACKLVPMSQAGYSHALPIDMAVITQCSNSQWNNHVVVGIGPGWQRQPNGGWRHSGTGALPAKKMDAAVTKEVAKRVKAKHSVVKLRLVELRPVSLQAVLSEQLPLNTDTRPIVALTLMYYQPGDPVQMLHFQAPPEEEEGVEEEGGAGEADDAYEMLSEAITFESGRSKSEETWAGIQAVGSSVASTSRKDRAEKLAKLMRPMTLDEVKLATTTKMTPSEMREAVTRPHNQLLE